jgi:hypothetical protein
LSGGLISRFWCFFLPSEHGIPCYVYYLQKQGKQINSPIPM